MNAVVLETLAPGHFIVELPNEPGIRWRVRSHDGPPALVYMERLEDERPST